ncbi:MAG: transposase family protein [Rickettsiales bacterium]|jgi:hypothetical protein|nr:transposase family protein [Rickettsiales bacterium]
MLTELEEAQRRKIRTAEHRIKLRTVDKLLMTLEYLRENRSFFHSAVSYQVHRTTVMRSIHWIEDVLSRCPEMTELLAGMPSVDSIPLVWPSVFLAIFPRVSLWDSPHGGQILSAKKWYSMSGRAKNIDNRLIYAIM